MERKSPGGWVFSILSVCKRYQAQPTTHPIPCTFDEIGLQEQQTSSRMRIARSRRSSRDVQRKPTILMMFFKRSENRVKENYAKP